MSADKLTPPRLASLAPLPQLAYAHAVQLLVDVFLLLTPFALFSEVGFWSIVATGVLTTFYQASPAPNSVYTLTFHSLAFMPRRTLAVGWKIVY